MRFGAISDPKRPMQDIAARPISPVSPIAQTPSVPAAVAPSLVRELLTGGGPVAIVPLVAALIEEASQLRASDAHIEPIEGGLRVRMRQRS